MSKDVTVNSTIKQSSEEVINRRTHNNPHYQHQQRLNGINAAPDGCLVCAPNSIERRKNFVSGIQIIDDNKKETSPNKRCEAVNSTIKQSSEEEKMWPHKIPMASVPSVFNTEKIVEKTCTSVNKDGIRCGLPINHKERFGVSRHNNGVQHRGWD